MIVNKFELRNKYKIVRQTEKSSEKDGMIYHSVLEYLKANEFDTVFIYYSSGTEVDTSSIIRFAIENGIDVALPRCRDTDGIMDFYIISDIDKQLVKGMFSLMEPDIDKCKKALHSEQSLCIVPGLAFDKAGCRIGYGKGYYDRFLYEFKGKSIGLCYNACLCDELPFDKYDCKVDIIVTENEFISIR